MWLSVKPRRWWEVKVLARPGLAHIDLSLDFDLSFWHHQDGLLEHAIIKLTATAGSSDDAASAPGRTAEQQQQAQAQQDRKAITDDYNRQILAK